jgi:abortive infection bacteriophage resistance protein
MFNAQLNNPHANRTIWTKGGLEIKTKCRWCQCDLIADSNKEAHEIMKCIKHHPTGEMLYVCNGCYAYLELAKKTTKQDEEAPKLPGMYIPNQSAILKEVEEERKRRAAIEMVKVTRENKKKLNKDILTNVEMAEPFDWQKQMQRNLILQQIREFNGRTYQKYVNHMRRIFKCRVHFMRVVLPELVCKTKKIPHIPRKEELRQMYSICVMITVCKVRARMEQKERFAEVMDELKKRTTLKS